MEVAIFLKLGDIKGEATDEGHVDEIKLSSLSFTSYNGSAYTNSSKTVSKGQATMGDITFSKEVDVASVKLFKSCASNEVHETATISFQANVGGDKKIDFLTYTLDKVVVNSYAFSAAGEAGESGSLTYAKIKQTYDVRDEMGSSKGKVEGFFDVLLNKAG